MESLTFEQLLAKHEEQGRRLLELEETIEAIRHGEVDALLMAGPEGYQVYTIATADRPYRLMIEEMQHGAVI